MKPEVKGTHTLTVRYTPPLTYQRTLDYAVRPTKVKLVDEEVSVLDALDDAEAGRTTYYSSDQEFLDSLQARLGE